MKELRRWEFPDVSRGFSGSSLESLNNIEQVNHEINEETCWSLPEPTTKLFNEHGWTGWTRTLMLLVMVLAVEQ